MIRKPVQLVLQQVLAGHPIPIKQMKDTLELDPEKRP